MKENYLVRINEDYKRYYYSAEAQNLKNETRTYDIKEGFEIPTSVAPIEIKSVIIKDDNLIGIELEYCDNGGNLQTSKLNVGDPEIRIVLTEGNPDIWRTSICHLKIIEK